MERKGLPTSKVIETAQLQLRNALHEAWDSLYWEPKVTTPQGDIKGFLLQQSEDDKHDRKVTYVSPEGKILEAGVDGTHEIDLPTYLRLAPSVEKALQEKREAQRQEIINDPEGRKILWRPGQFRFGYWYCRYNSYGSGMATRVIEVIAKKDGLYCPNHPEKKLFMERVPSEGREKFIVCPDKDCSFEVYSGT